MDTQRQKPFSTVERQTSFPGSGLLVDAASMAYVPVHRPSRKNGS